MWRFAVNHCLVESAPSRYGTYRGALFFDRKIRITRTTAAKIPATTRIRVTLSIVSLHSPTVHSRCRKRNSPEGGGPDVLFDKLNSIFEKTLLGIDLGYDPC